jgi:hypothetical protein
MPSSTNSVVSFDINQLDFQTEIPDVIAAVADN